MKTHRKSLAGIAALVMSFWMLAGPAWSSPVQVRTVDMAYHNVAGNQYRGTVYLTEVASERTYVHLEGSSDLLIPGTVVVPAGQDRISFPVNVREYATDSTLEIAARCGGTVWRGQAEVQEAHIPLERSTARRGQLSAVNSAFGESSVYRAGVNGGLAPNAAGGQADVYKNATLGYPTITSGDSGLACYESPSNPGASKFYYRDR